MSSEKNKVPIKLSKSYYNKYLKYKSKYLELKNNLKNSDKLVGGTVASFIILAHGFFNADMNRASAKPYDFTIQSGINIHTFVRIGETLYCTNKKPNRICQGTDKPTQSYITGQFPNYVLKSDLSYPPELRANFHSGVKRCDTNEIIINLDDRYLRGEQYLFLEDIVNEIIRYCMANIPGISHANIYLLTCLEGLSEDFTTDIKREVLTDDFARLRI